MEEEDRAREEWFRNREQKRRERELESERVEQRRKEVIELIKKQEEKERLSRDGLSRRTGRDDVEDRGGMGKEKGGGFWGSARR